MAWLDRIETDIKAVWYQWSTKVMASLMVFPEAYNVLSSFGWYQSMPSVVAHVMSGLATAGFLAKFYKQKAKEESP